MAVSLTHQRDDGSTVLITSASDDPLAVLAALGDATEHLQRWRLEAVTRARTVGRSWAEIGEALGVSRQAAWELFRDDVGRMIDEVRDLTVPEDEAAAIVDAEVRAMRAERRRAG